MAMSASSSSNTKFYGREVILYHYTTDRGAAGIKRDKQMKERPNGVGGHEKHGRGVNFTSLDPYTKVTYLIKNNFLSSGVPLKREGISFYHRMQYVVRIQFRENDPIEKIRDGLRNLFVHRGDIDLRNYEGRYSIYPNPNAPSASYSDSDDDSDNHYRDYGDDYDCFDSDNDLW